MKSGNTKKCFPDMKYKKLGNSDISVSVIGFGCWAIGGKKWGPTDDSQSKKALLKAADLGVNFYDTADFYGYGHSEELLCEAFKNRDDIIIATKCGLRWNNKGKIFHDLSHKHVKQACENSLKRLKRDFIDLYQIHWPDPATPLSDTISALNELVIEGKIRYVGVCNFRLDLLDEIKKYDWFISDQEEFNLLNQNVKNERILFCKKNGIAFIGYEPLYKGMLTGKFKERPVFEKGDHRKYKKRFNKDFEFYKSKVDKLTKLSEENSLTTTQLALALLLNNEGVTSIIPGAKTVNQVEENVSAINADKDLVSFLYPKIREIFNE